MKPPGRLAFLTLPAALLIILFVGSCSKDNSPRAPLPENPERIPCEVCTSFAGYYELRDVSVNTINGTDIWSPLPVSTINGKIYAGYLILNTFSELTVYRSGELFNYQEFTTSPFSYSEFYNYWILSDSTMAVGPEKEAASFYPHLGPDAVRVDTVIWDRCRYVRN